jgi:FAS-associated factor 2
MRDFFDEHFIFWGSSLKMTEGYQISNLLNASTYPFIGIICNNTTSGLAIMDRIEGVLQIEDLFTKLTNILETHGTLLSNAKHEFEERDKDRRLRQEQDDAFLQSLAQDQAKERFAIEQKRILEEQKSAKEREAIQFIEIKNVNYFIII